ncbi:hypothetical protein DDZ14_10380 [Maritimibacter sp. 55A14]|nr:hypothetical protein DDZ14_10380 [Maritimibacter sp. 55A14]
MGVYGRRTVQSMSPTDIVGAILTVLWAIAVGLFFLLLDPDTEGGADPAGTAMTFVAIFLPVALIWVACSVAKTSRIMREESARLQSALDSMRQAYVTDRQNAGMAIKPSVERKLDEIAAAQKKAESALASFNSRREIGAPAQPPAEKPALGPAPEAETQDTQPSLALGGTPDPYRTPITVSEFVRALNFPENENDREGFRALRRALEDHDVARLVRAAQDVLTLLSQDGIYMDDLVPDRSRPEVWRKFATGARGGEIAALGGVRDRSSLALSAGRMKKDPVFRDAVHHFLRQFDKTFAAFEPNARDQDVAELANTRTARAFMLLGRVTGMFD